MDNKTIAKENRHPDHDLEEIFYTRWSPRAMSGEKLKREEILPLFEAARWAPSSMNEQPWRFIVGEKEKFIDFLVGNNQIWCAKASYLVIVLSKKTFTYHGKNNETASFDTGAAWENLALQGTKNNLVVHAMVGILKDKIRSTLKIPEDYNIEAMIAIGKPADKKTLPLALQEREIPSTRKKIEEFTSFEGFNW